MMCRWPASFPAGSNWCHGGCRWRGSCQRRRRGTRLERDRGCSRAGQWWWPWRWTKKEENYLLLQISLLWSFFIMYVVFTSSNSGFLCVLFKLQISSFLKQSFFSPHILTSLKSGYVFQLLSAMWQGESWQLNALIGSRHPKLEIGCQLIERTCWRRERSTRTKWCICMKTRRWCCVRAQTKRVGLWPCEEFLGKPWPICFVSVFSMYAQNMWINLDKFFK